MTHPGKLSIKILALAALLGCAAPGAWGQEGDEAAASQPSAQDRAERVAADLTTDLPCTATGTADALERRLTQSIDPLTDLAAGLEIMSASTTNCAEIRAAAARQRQFITQSALSGGETVSMATIGTTWALAFEVGPPPLNLLRGRGASR